MKRNLTSLLIVLLALMFLWPETTSAQRGIVGGRGGKGGVKGGASVSAKGYFRRESTSFIPRHGPRSDSNFWKKSPAANCQSAPSHVSTSPPSGTLPAPVSEQPTGTASRALNSPNQVIVNLPLRQAPHQEQKSSPVIVNLPPKEDTKKPPSK